ncbi:exonuclease SbcCD subunit D [Marinagarivorans cellulosilyticus]|uniref:Nuclease SbcCD subunit D n=1 Tax=Marinagarivorans cellulosilyticus TaxID=2721545 RepID=A0AAN1WLA8_9GAMM|nr:exonuclease SbcCD subunit D [Marinagarivorans cellulosilyticus]BCD99612.1 DNA repair protein SbcD/Mre11 [Marinagarivorans cellulosilyticus]
MKFLHTSDWHLGRLFHNVSLLEDQAHALSQIIGLAVEHNVDAVLVAGDIYDRAVPPAGAIALLDEALHTLSSVHNIPVILISGNHDSAERLAFGARQLASQNVHILHQLKDSQNPVTVKSKLGESAAIYGIPYHTPEQIRSDFQQPCSTFDQAQRFMVERIQSQPTTADFQILMSHCFVDGADACDSERPLSIGGADRVSASPMAHFDYVALGHLHGQQQRGAEHIRYSGSPLKYSFSEENHHKAVTLVELQKGQPANSQQLAIKPLRNMRTLEGSIDALITNAKDDPHSEDYLAITLTDQHAILDAMAKLRCVYPNVLLLEKTFLQREQQLPQSGQRLQKNTLAMFQDFYQELQGTALTQEQEQYLEQVLTDLNKQISQGDQ